MDDCNCKVTFTPASNVNMNAGIMGFYTARCEQHGVVGSRMMLHGHDGAAHQAAMEAKIVAHVEDRRLLALEAEEGGEDGG